MRKQTTPIRQSILFRLYIIFGIILLLLISAITLSGAAYIKPMLAETAAGKRAPSPEGDQQSADSGSHTRAGAERNLNTFLLPLITTAAVLFIIFSVVFLMVVSKTIVAPIKRLIEGTRLITNGEYLALDNFKNKNEIGILADSISRMSDALNQRKAALNKQKNEFQTLFELVPCLITIQDKEYNLIGYNNEFSKRFGPSPGDFCYHAYKGLKEKCTSCPVEKTFADGRPHYSEEAGVGKDGTPHHWIVKTAPMKDEQGEVIAAMEMSLDITPIKNLENELHKSEVKYFSFFNNIPNPVFVLDIETLEILDCNVSASSVYGYNKEDLLTRSFLDLFDDGDKPFYASQIKTSSMLAKAKQINGRGETLFANIRISPLEDNGSNVFLVTTSDVTKMLEAESQLVHAGKMATLGEMATGVAHELNQPLTVIKTASGFLMKKIKKKEPIKQEIMVTMMEEVDRHVDRASSIIGHLRQFGRKADISLETVQINDILLKASEIFIQQLKLREIEVEWCLADDLPQVVVEPIRLEQVVVNLLINARDAIEERWEGAELPPWEKRKITLETSCDKEDVIVKVMDTGTGIPDTVASKIFEPFFTTKKVGEGTGIGLSISYSIIQDFGGSITLDNTTDRGACFVIRFPRRDK